MGLFSSIANFAAPILGSVIGGVSSAYGAKKANEESEAATQKQMDFQERMRGSQYQAAMDDMRSAGLNPMLAYKQGGAGTPGGSTYSPINVGSAGAAGAGAGASTASQIQRYDLEKRANLAQVDKLYTAAKLDQSADDLTYQKRLNSMTEGQILKEELQIRKAGAASAKGVQRFYESPAGKAAQLIDLTGRSINPFAWASGQMRR